MKRETIKKLLDNIPIDKIAIYTDCIIGGGKSIFIIFNDFLSLTISNLFNLWNRIPVN